MIETMKEMWSRAKLFHVTQKIAKNILSSWYPHKARLSRQEILVNKYQNNNRKHKELSISQEGIIGLKKTIFQNHFQHENTRCSPQSYVSSSKRSHLHNMLITIHHLCLRVHPWPGIRSFRSTATNTKNFLQKIMPA